MSTIETGWIEHAGKTYEFGATLHHNYPAVIDYIATPEGQILNRKSLRYKAIESKALDIVLEVE